MGKGRASLFDKVLDHLWRAAGTNAEALPRPADFGPFGALGSLGPLVSGAPAAGPCESFHHFRIRPHMEVSSCRIPCSRSCSPPPSRSS